MKRIGLIFLLTFLCSAMQQAQAQQKVAYVGEVRDSLGLPLEFANVMAMDTTKKTIAAFGVTNKQGQFKLLLENQKVYQIKVSFIGFVPFERYFTAKDTQALPVSIQLNNDERNLGSVEVVSEMAVLIQGDTITYKADVFTQGNERKLEDVLKDLPGFEVDEDGQVTVQGKRVDKLLVDGKEFFEGDTKLATKNLPAKAVDKVQVLQNFNDVGPLSGVNNSEQLALNIQLKEDMKNMIFGDLELGAGPEERYKAHANVFYYDKKTNINFIGDANNVGDLAFSMSDYFRFSGGLAGLTGKSGSNFQVSSDQLGIPMAEKNSAKELNNQLGALNYNFTPSSKIRFSGFAIGSKVDNTLGNISERQYVLQSGQKEILNSESNVKSTSGLFKLGITYSPDASLQLDYNVFSRLSNIENSDLQNSLFNNQSNDINGLTTQQPYSIEQQLRAFYAPDEKNVFSVEATYKDQEQDPNYDLQTTKRPFAAIIPMTGNSPYNLLQLKNIGTRQAEAAINYYRILNNTNHINFKLGLNRTSQDLNSSIQEKLDNGSKNDFNDPGLNNLVDYTFSDYYFSLFYKVKFGKLVMNPGLNLHRYNIENQQNGITKGLDKTLLLPSFNAKYNFRNSHSLNLNYGVAASFTDIQNAAQGIIVRGYNSLFAGNPVLDNSWYHNLSLNYFNFNMYNFLNVSGGVNYQKRFDDITNIIDFSGLERVNTPVNIDVANENLSGNASIDKRFDHYRLSLSGNWSRSVTNNRISDLDNENVSFQQGYKAGLSTTVFKALELNFYYAVSFNNYTARSTSSKFENHKPSAKVILRFLKDFRFDTDYEYNKYKNTSNGTESNYGLLNAKLSYRKEGSKWEFKTSAMNLLNTTGVRRDSFSESLISTYEYFIQKRYFLLSAIYDL
ncbi:carboxypeptidase-like regulatory domain-containing protein [Roseivirga echinicomitans]